MIMLQNSKENNKETLTSSLIQTLCHTHQLIMQELLLVPLLDIRDFALEENGLPQELQLLVQLLSLCCEY